MSPRILIALVLVEYRVDMYLPVVRPLHQFRYDACRFAGAVDVIHHVTDTVYHHQTKVRRMVDCLFDNPYALLRRVFPQGKELKVLVVPVIGQPCHAHDAFHHIQAVVRALLRIDIQHFPLGFGKLSRIPEHRAVLQSRSHDSRHIECLLALGFADGCAEISQRTDYGTFHAEDFGRFLVFSRQAQP